MLILIVSKNDSHAAKIKQELAENGLDWQLAWVRHAEDALSLPADQAPEVLVCSAGLGQNYGLTLLGQLRARHPEAVSILLIDAGHDHDAIHALEVSHRVLPEPLETLPLIEAVESVMELRALLDDPVLKKAIGKVGSLPTAPRLYLALTRLLRDPESSAARIADVVAQDPAVAAKVLRLTNSAYYSAGREISDLRTAVSRVGLNALRQLVLASEVFSTNVNSGDADAMRDRALRISRLAGQLLAGPSSGLAVTAGLLAEVGQLLPPLATGDSGVTPYSIAGAYLLGMWGLPTPIVEAVAFHQCPARIRGGFWVTGAVHVAAALVNGTEVNEQYLRGVGQLDKLPHWRQLAEALAEAA